MKQQLDFNDLEVGQTFAIPSGGGPDDFEEFVKLPFNKARSVERNTVEHFPDEASVWLLFQI